MAARALAVAVLLLTSAACGSSGGSPSSGVSPTGTSASAASGALCDDLQALRTTVDQLKSLDTSTVTAAEVQSLLEQAQAELTKASQDASGAARAEISAIQTAYTALVAALRALPTSISGTQAFQQVQPQLTALVSALGSAAGGANCPSTPSSS
jgi:hypothetical protein